MRYLFILSILFLFSCENANTPKEDEVETYATSETSNITCPNCGHTETEILPTEQCQLLYDCKNCKYTMKPNGNDCCVFCTYGDHKCPSMQEDEKN